MNERTTSVDDRHVIVIGITQHFSISILFYLPDKFLYLFFPIICEGMD